MKTEEQAREYVASRCDYASAPVLTSEEIATCTADALIYSEHAVSTPYKVGDRVAPTTRNGRMYECIQGGDSGATVPTWPTCGAPGHTVSDGDDVIWQDVGPAPKERYDLNAAIRAAWMLKAAKAAAWADVSDGDASIKRDQIIKHCQQMANRYPSVFVT